MNDYGKVSRNIYNLTKLIFNYYKKLAIIKANKGVDTQEYNNVLKNLYETLKKENDIYDALQHNRSFALRVHEFIFPNGFPVFLDELKIIQTFNKERLIKLRIGEKISKALLNEDYIEESFDKYFSNVKNDVALKMLNKNYLEEEEDYLEQFGDIDFLNEDGYIDETKITPEVVDKLFDFFVGDSFKEEMRKNYLNDYKFDMAIQDDILKTILKFIKIYSNDPEYQKMLIKLKTSLTFVFPGMEQLLLDNDMKIPDELVWNSFMVGNIQGNKSNQVSLVMQHNYIIDLVQNCLNSYRKIKNIKDVNIRKEKILYTEIILRSCMMFLRIEDAVHLMDFIDKSLGDLASETDINASLNRVFVNRQTDIDLPYIISLDSDNFKR